MRKISLIVLFLLSCVGLNAQDDAVIYVHDASKPKADFQIKDAPLVRTKEFYVAKRLGRRQIVSDSLYILKIPTYGKLRLTQCSWPQMWSFLQLLSPNDTLHVHIKMVKAHDYQVTFSEKRAENYEVFHRLMAPLSWNRTMSRHQLPSEDYLSLVHQTYLSHVELINKEVKGAAVKDLLKAEELGHVFAAIDFMEHKPSPERIDSLRKIYIPNEMITCQNPLYLRLPYYMSGMSFVAMLLCNRLTLNDMTNVINARFDGLLKEYLYSTAFYLCCKGKIGGQAQIRKWYRMYLPHISQPAYKAFVRQVYTRYLKGIL